MNFKNKNVLVYGLGKSGIATANLLHQKRANVFLYDDDKTIFDAIKNSNLLVKPYDIIF